MPKLTSKQKQKVENYLKENESATRVEWTDDDVCTTFDEEGNAIDDYMIEIDEDAVLCYTPVSDWNETISIE